MKNKKLKLVKIFDVASKIILFLYIVAVLLFAYQMFLFNACYDENLKNTRDFLGLPVECGEGIAVAVAAVYMSLAKVVLLIMFPFVVGFRVAVYFYAKSKG